MPCWRHLILLLLLATWTSLAQVPAALPVLQGGEVPILADDAPRIAGPKRSSAKPKPGARGGPGAGKRFPEAVKDEAEKQADGKCVFCGRETSREPGPTQRNTDHAIPKSRDGNTTLDNAQNTCRDCNLEKGAKTTEEHLREKK